MNDIDSRVFKTYLCEYYYQGHKWSVDILATSFEDAEERLKALRNGHVKGELGLSIPLPKLTRFNWFNRIINRFK